MRAAVSVANHVIENTLVNANANALSGIPQFGKTGIEFVQLPQLPVISKLISYETCCQVHFVVHRRDSR